MESKMEITSTTLLTDIIGQYRNKIRNHSFSGIKLRELSIKIDDADLKDAVSKLIKERKIDVICSSTQLNPHIKRFPAHDIETQISNLDVNEKYHTCIYLTKEMILQHCDLSSLDGKPFSKELALGAPHLEAKFFEIDSLDRYRLDPRYEFHFAEYSGTLSILMETEKTGPILDRDQTSIQTFGLGVDDEGNPKVCVFLRYLSSLTPEHQRHWETYLTNKHTLMHKNYYKPSYLGEIWENNSAIQAIRLSIKSINTICESLWHSRLFSQDVPKDIHYNLSPFMRSSKSDYLMFVHELDKLISENLNIKFFDGKVERFEIQEHADGTFERKVKGSLTLLDEWLFNEVSDLPSIDEARKEIITPLRRIRRERQNAAHAILKNEYDMKYFSLRRDILRNAAFALGNILFILKHRPGAPQITIPAWLEKAEIEVF